MTNYFELIRIFCAVVNAESFKQAAIQLGKSPQAITRAIQELEEIKGEILFYRSTRNHKITKEGEVLFENAQPLLHQINVLVDKNLQNSHQELSGQIRLTMPTAFGRHLVLPLLTKFQVLYPKIKISCLLTDDHVDVIEKQIDIGLRTGFLHDNRFVSRKVKNVDFYLVAAPDLIQKTGLPKQLMDLERFPIAALDNVALNQYWAWGFENDQTYLPKTPCFSSNDLDAYTQALVEGLGFGHLPDFIATPLIKKGQLVHVMPYIQSSPWGLYLYRPQLGPTSQKIRLLYDFLVEHFISD